MKRSTLFFYFILAAWTWACSTPPQPTETDGGTKEPVIQKDTIVEEDTAAAVPTMNFTDTNGLKQGRWEVFTGGRLWKVNQYKDGQLHGKCVEYWANGEVMETDYVAGKRHGYFLHYDPTAIHGKIISYFEEDERFWSAFPWELDSFIVPVKGFLPEKDTVEIKVHYNDCARLYQGTVVKIDNHNGQGIGLHEAWYPSGALKATVDYDQDTIAIYDQKGQLIQASSIEEWWGKKIPRNP